MLNQYSRLEMLIGEDKLKQINEKRIIVFGLGGVGGNCVEALVRSGIKHLDLVDNDVISLTNINRQLIATHHDIGRKKTEVMKERILSICPDATVDCHDIFYLKDDERIDLGNYDYVIDCIDTVTAKINLITKCQELAVPIICAMGTGNKLDPSMLEITDIYKTEYDPLAKIMRHELRKRGIRKLTVVYSKEKPLKAKPNAAIIKETAKRSVPGSSAFVPPAAGIMIASKVIRDFLAD
ncbi:MAG: tRNA threonylcarbamoyladenosine dehydratase [Erysipelotrichaceae bacterium]|nr:tRNA threonylcarbamoyladenosine dehydratase [Erysipelotrichaceae bacterium]